MTPKMLAALAAALLALSACMPTTGGTGAPAVQNTGAEEQDADDPATEVDNGTDTEADD